MIHAHEILRDATPSVLKEEAVGGKFLSEEAQEASNKMNRQDYILFFTINVIKYQIFYTDLLLVYGKVSFPFYKLSNTQYFVYLFYMARITYI